MPRANSRNPASALQVRFWRDPDLPGVEVRFSSYNEEAFRKHTHDAYSVGLIETGRTTFFLEGDVHSASAGQMALIPPGAVHACNPDFDSEMAYRMFYVDGSWLTEAAEEVLGTGTPLPVFRTPVVDDPELFAAWRDLHLTITRGADKLEKQSRLVQCLSSLVAGHAVPGQTRAPGKAAGVVHAIHAHLAARLEENVTLDDLSALTGLSRFHLLRTYQEEVGLPPHAHQNQLRVDRSKALLANGMSISRVAAETGFVDQSHFTRVFKQFTGATPRQYQSVGR
ncbi:AraC family transcriptional regulator [Desulfonatronum sp. SC1]|uniref:AraC family transcriptional regulator n=1 Tax=Desulfonatronum sp. SC1 TaxID=2109626 RepID=UPI000D30ABDF|nr:AraC family transcriptional regulator [Desulfonatronum sp. SC1]PTN39065.1 AraC family transcriptional regulator [Desulfonatronum sp. SC1]